MSLPNRLIARLRAAMDAPALRKSPLFDAAWYLDSYPDVAATGADPALHYLTHGAAEGRDPGPLFSTSGWRLQGHSGRGNPLLQHLRTGAGVALPGFAGSGLAGSGLAEKEPVVLFVGHQAPCHPFGAERSLLTMLERARSAGLAAELVLPHCQSPAYLEECRARVRRVHLLPFVWRRAGRQPHPATLAAFAAILQQSGATEVHQNTLVLDLPLIAARAAGLPSVVHLRELPAGDAELCARMALSPETLRRDLLAGADRLVANSAAVARWLDPQGLMPPGRLVIRPNTVDPRLAGLPFAPADPPRVALISSNVAKKGIADMVRVAQIFAGRGGRADFLLIGPPTPDVAALGPLPANLRLAGYAEGPLTALAGCDVVLSLSQFAESFGRSVLEAMTAGRPVIAYDRGTPPALLGRETGDVGPGAVVPADDPAAVARALLALLADPARMAAASQAGRARAADLARTAEAIPAGEFFTRQTGTD